MLTELNEVRCQCSAWYWLLTGARYMLANCKESEEDGVHGEDFTVSVV